MKRRFFLTNHGLLLGYRVGQRPLHAVSIPFSNKTNKQVALLQDLLVVLVYLLWGMDKSSRHALPLCCASCNCRVEMWFLDLLKPYTSASGDLFMEAYKLCQRCPPSLRA